MLPVIVLEPVSYSKRRRYSEIIREPRRSLQPGIDDIKQKLKQIRSDTLDHLDYLVDEFTDHIARYPEVELIFAADAEQAAKKILEISGSTLIATNRSSVITIEIAPHLNSSSSPVIESYYEEFNPIAPVFDENLQFPVMPFESRLHSFERQADLSALRSKSIEENGTKDFVGLIGVNAVSAEDGTAVMLQHMNNISKIFLHAREVILVAGLDKIVRATEDAVFQSKCMAIFGSETLRAAIRNMSKRKSSLDTLPFNKSKNGSISMIHLILLDNGRRFLAESPYRELLMCIDCRACNGACPAYLCSKPLVPSELPIKFRRDLLETGIDISDKSGDIKIRPVTFNLSTLRREGEKGEIWNCTACGNCHEICPAGISHVDTIQTLRMNMVMENADMPETVSRALRSIENRGHPWRGTTCTRADWAQGLSIKTLSEDSDVDILYWVGCTIALEDRTMNIARAMAELFMRAGIKAGFLGTGESCCGEPAHRLGNEYLYRQQVRKNIDLMKRYNITRIVTACPHCYHTLKNDYPDYGGDFEVVDHIQFIASLLNEQRMSIGEYDEKVLTYHDPCMLGRYNGIYEQPRKLLHGLSGMKLVEMAMNREQSFCCGGGGGNLWLDDNNGKRIGDARFEQAIAAGAQVIATACPFCLQILDEAKRMNDSDSVPEVLDIAELIVQSANKKRDL
jgi:Fe-S oxidoreductase